MGKKCIHYSRGLHKTVHFSVWNADFSLYHLPMWRKYGFWCIRTFNSTDSFSVINNLYKWAIFRDYFWHFSFKFLFIWYYSHSRILNPECASFLLSFFSFLIYCDIYLGVTARYSSRGVQCWSSEQSGLHAHHAGCPFCCGKPRGHEGCGEALHKRRRQCQGQSGQGFSPQLPLKTSRNYL